MESIGFPTLTQNEVRSAENECVRHKDKMARGDI